MLHKDHYIHYLAIESAVLKEPCAIDYKNELSSGIRLTPITELTTDGLIKTIKYLHGDRPVLLITEKYFYSAKDEADLTIPKSKRGLNSRLKTWQYYFDDGSLDVSKKIGTYKEKTKIYDDFTGIAVGKKRRFNIMFVFSINAGAALTILGDFKDGTEARNNMRELSAKYSSNFSEFEHYGTELILDDILNDSTFNWFNKYVPSANDLKNMVAAGQMDTATETALNNAFNYYKLDSVRGLTIRQYCIEKLKGNIY